MARCPVCGSTFESSRYQIVLPGVASGFDRLECADRYLAGVPLVWVTEPDEGLDDLASALLEPIRARWALPAALLMAAAVATASAAVLLPSPREPGGKPAAAERPRVEGVSSPEGRLVRGASAQATRPEPEPRRTERRRDAAVVLISASRGRTSGADAAADAGKAADAASPPSPSDPAPPAPEPAPPAATTPERPAAAEPTHPPRVSARPAKASRPGWGHGDRNHAHSGPRGASSERTAKARRSRGR